MYFHNGHVIWCLCIDLMYYSFILRLIFTKQNKNKQKTPPPFFWKKNHATSKKIIIIMLPLKKSQKNHATSQICIRPTIRIGRESWSLPSVGFL